MPRQMTTSGLGVCVALQRAADRLGLSREATLRLALLGRLRVIVLGESQVFIALQDVETLVAERAPQRLFAPQVTPA